MKKELFLLGAIVLTTVLINIPVHTVMAENPKKADVVVEAPKKLEWTAHQIAMKIDEHAAKYGVSASLMKALVNCESMGSTTIQSYARYTKNHPEWGVKKGQRELSWGLSQLHLPAHKDITKDEATDPDFALDYMAKRIAKGHASEWSCYQMI